MLRLMFRTIAPSLAIAFALVTVQVANADDNELKGKDLRWLEEDVAAIITDEEIEIYKSIDKDDRKLFRDIFWERRDPNPATSDNEFEKDFEERQKTAKKEFKAQGKDGHLTDMGKIYSLLGAPSRTEGSGQDVTWHYDPDPRHGLPEGLTIRFTGGRLEASTDLENTLNLVKNRLVANPTVMYVRSLEGRLLEPRKTDPNSPAAQVLNALRDTKSPSADIPFETSFAFFRASAGQIYIPILYEIDGGSLTWSADAANLTVFGVVENTEGIPIFQFEEPAALEKAADGRTLYEVPIQLQPGNYTLYTGVQDNESSTAGTKISELEVPDFYIEDLVMSSVVVYDEAKEVSDTAGTPGHAFQFGPVKFRPAETFGKDDVIGFFFFVYGLGTDENDKPNITGQYIFFKDGERKGQTKDGPLQADARQAVGNAEIPLSAFEPGNYKIRVKVTDHILKKTLNEEVDFVVEPAPGTP